MFLNLPFGATSGFVSGMLGFLLKEKGAGDDVLATLGALSLFPNTWKFVWAPIADSTLTRKRWYILANIASCAILGVLAFVPIDLQHLDLIEGLVLVNSFAITFLGMSVEGLMAHATPPEERGRAAGWFQAGNLGGGGLGGFVGLLLAQYVSTLVGFITLAAVLFACTFALRFVPEAPRLLDAIAAKASAVRRFGNAIQIFLRSLVTVIRDVIAMVGNRRGIVAVTLVFLPIGSAALGYLFSGALSTQSHAGAGVVATTTGLAGGVVSAAGCLVGGVFSDRAGRRRAYLLSGVIMAVVAVAWALVPKNEMSFIVMVLLSQFGGGIAYGTFTGFVLEMIGSGAAATKYNIFASLSNVPILYMTKLNGWASDTHGLNALLLTDAASEIAGILLFLVVLAIVRPGKETRELPA
jgi:MFS family permease